MSKKNTPQEPHFFGCKIERFLSLSALETARHKYDFDDLVRRQTEFLGCLINQRDERVTYDLRIISRPDPENSLRGTIEVFILGRLDGGTPVEATARARDFFNLVRASFSEYDVCLAGPEEIAATLAPFQPACMAAITRRCAWINLDTLQRGVTAKHLGFLRQEPTEKTGERAGTVHHVYPHLPVFSSHYHLFRLLLSLKDPVAISARLHPTCLTAAEEAFFVEQIATCESFSQFTVIGGGTEPGYLKPTLHEQARTLQRYQMQMLQGLQDDASILTLYLSSPGPIPAVLTDLLGHLVTAPTGSGGQSHEEHHFAGGYEVVDESGSAEAALAFTRMAIYLPRHPLAPPGPERIPFLFNALEAVTVFRLPQPTLESLPGPETRPWRSRPASPDLPKTGVFAGVSEHSGVTQEVRIGEADRLRHFYAIGQTGTGKTTMLKSMILDDIRSGQGLCVIDPHGDLFQEVLGKIPEHRLADVIVLDPFDAASPVALNLLEYKDPAERYFLVSEFCAIIRKLVQDEYQSRSGEFMGPVFFQHVRMNALLAMSDPDEPGTILDFYNIFCEKNYWRRWLPLKVTDTQLDRWVENVLPGIDYLKPGSENLSMGGYISSKFERFAVDPAMRNLFGKKRSTIDFRAAMDTGKIILVNLAKGLLSEDTSRFLGMVVLGKIQAAALSRISAEQSSRRPFYVYIDEFQSISTQTLIGMLSEGRKFGLGLVLANQFISQLENERVTEAIFGNVGTIVSFRVGRKDADNLENYLMPYFNQSDLVSLPNTQAVMKTMINGEAVEPFSLKSALDRSPWSAETAARVREHSRTWFGCSEPVREKSAQSTKSVVDELLDRG